MTACRMPHVARCKLANGCILHAAAQLQAFCVANCKQMTNQSDFPLARFSPNKEAKNSQQQQQQQLQPEVAAKHNIKRAAAETAAGPINPIPRDDCRLNSSPSQAAALSLSLSRALLDMAQTGPGQTSCCCCCCSAPSVPARGRGTGHGRQKFLACK